MLPEARVPLNPTPLAGRQKDYRVRTGQSLMTGGMGRFSSASIQ